MQLLLYQHSGIFSIFDSGVPMNIKLCYS